MAITEEKLKQIEQALRKLESAEGRRAFFDKKDITEVPAALQAVHDNLTVPHEGGYQNRDGENGTLAGITNAVFRQEMKKLGLNLTVKETREFMEYMSKGLKSQSTAPELASTATQMQKTLWPLVQNFNSLVHYDRYILTPGFDALTMDAQIAVYDAALWRGYGSGVLLPLARMAERYGIEDFPGINSIDNPSALDADSLAMERLLEEHIAEYNGVKPKILANELWSHGMTVNGIKPDGTTGDPKDGVRIADSTRWEDININSNALKPRNSIVIMTPYDDRLFFSKTYKAEFDAMVERVAKATRIMSEKGWTVENLIYGVASERLHHQNQLLIVQEDNDRNAAGWDRRSRETADIIPKLPEVKQASLRAPEEPTYHAAVIAAAQPVVAATTTPKTPAPTSSGAITDEILIEAKYRRYAKLASEAEEIALYLPGLSQPFIYEITPAGQLMSPTEDRLPAGITTHRSAQTGEPFIRWSDGTREYQLTLNPSLNKSIRATYLDEHGEHVRRHSGIVNNEFGPAIDGQVEVRSRPVPLATQISEYHGETLPSPTSPLQSNSIARG